jgi:hypothetical protein
MYIDQLKDVRGISIEQANTSPIVEVRIDNIILVHCRWWSDKLLFTCSGNSGYLDQIKVKFFINLTYFVENKGLEETEVWIKSGRNGTLAVITIKCIPLVLYQSCWNNTYGKNWWRTSHGFLQLLPWQRMCTFIFEMFIWPY